MDDFTCYDGLAELSCFFSVILDVFNGLIRLKWDLYRG
jgi:hypothetical protein